VEGQGPLAGWGRCNTSTRPPRLRLAKPPCDAIWNLTEEAPKRNGRLPFVSQYRPRGREQSPNYGKWVYQRRHAFKLVRCGYYDTQEEAATLGPQGLEGEDPCRAVGATSATHERVADRTMAQDCGLKSGETAYCASVCLGRDRLWDDDPIVFGCAEVVLALPAADQTGDSSSSPSIGRSRETGDCLSVKSGKWPSCRGGHCPDQPATVPSGAHVLRRHVRQRHRCIWACRIPKCACCCRWPCGTTWKRFSAATLPGPCKRAGMGEERKEWDRSALAGLDKVFSEMDDARRLRPLTKTRAGSSCFGDHQAGRLHRRVLEMGVEIQMGNQTSPPSTRTPVKRCQAASVAGRNIWPMSREAGVINWPHFANMCTSAVHASRYGDSRNNKFETL
jgi:hypothetical protein